MAVDRSRIGRYLLFVAILLSGIAIRLIWMNDSALWCDEAESSINALSIQETGVPSWTYLGIPVFENTLTEPWIDHPEYEFRDSSYSERGVAVYHGWIPLYAIAASQWIFGIHPDQAVSPPAVQHLPSEAVARTRAPRIPSVIFSLFCLVVVYRLGLKLGGPSAGLAAMTLMALNAQTVDFGVQARYYSATLLFTATSALGLLNVVRLGRCRDYLLLGISLALLFHTHLFSTIIFALVAVTISPATWRHRHWIPKAAAGGLLVAALTLPWIALTGFLHTASSVPKAWRVFDSPSDGVAYLLDRPASLILVAVVIATLVATRWTPGIFPRRIVESIRSHTVIYGTVLIWMVYAYAGFHFMMPAASYFIERLNLVLWTPFVLLLSLFIADLFRGLPIARSQLAAVGAAILLLIGRHNFAFFQSTSLGAWKISQVQSIIYALADQTFPAAAKFYGNPNDHLVVTYYTGLPVQSVAPIRRKFFETYPGEIVYIERQLDVQPPTDDTLDELQDSSDAPSNPTERNDLRAEVWSELIRRSLARRGFDDFSQRRPDLAFERLTDSVESKAATATREMLDGYQQHPILRKIPAATHDDVWFGFFYQFVDPAARIGANLNILARIRNATIIPVYGANTVVFVSASPGPLPVTNGN